MQFVPTPLVCLRQVEACAEKEARKQLIALLSTRLALARLACILLAKPARHIRIAFPGETNTAPKISPQCLRARFVRVEARGDSGATPGTAAPGRGLPHALQGLPSRRWRPALHAFPERPAVALKRFGDEL